MSDVTVLEVPEIPPADIGDARVELANLFLHGDGLEVGALHLATALPPGSRARYVDRMSVSDLRAHYPELQTLDLAPVDVIDDGERLDTIAPESVDFIVANHFLEHCEDPIRTIETHLSKLKPGGTLFYAVPDKRYTFDYQRPRTPLQHIIEDHEHGPEHSRADHYVAWVRAGLVPGFVPVTEQDIQDKAAELQCEDYSIHFHVWTQADLAALMFHIHERLGNFEVEAIRRHSIESIVVLRKHGEPPTIAAPQPTATPSTPAPAATPSPNREPPRPGLPLGGLRAALDAGSAVAHWSVDPDGIAGRAWVIGAEQPVTIPLRLDCPIRLQARAQLLTHDWREGTGEVLAWVAVRDGAGGLHRLWSARLSVADDLEGVELDCELPDRERGTADRRR